jgi:hypothetical protein
LARFKQIRFRVKSSNNTSSNKIASKFPWYQSWSLSESFVVSLVWIFFWNFFLCKNMWFAIKNSYLIFFLTISIPHVDLIKRILLKSNLKFRLLLNTGRPKNNWMLIRTLVGLYPLLVIISHLFKKFIGALKTYTIH